MTCRSVRYLFIGFAVLGMLVALALFAAPTSTATATSPDPDDTITLTLFRGDGCPHCERALAFLDGLSARWPELVVDDYEVWHSEMNQAIFNDAMSTLGETPRAVPTIIVRERVWVGFSDAIGEDIEAVIEALVEGTAVPELDAGTVDVPIVGDVDVEDHSLVVATLAIGFVDGLNPCSLWVLSVLLALVLHSGSRARVLLVGTVFLGITSALYGLYMVGAYSALDYAGEASWIRSAVAAVAGMFGILHLKEFFTSRGPSVTIATSRKPGLYRRMRELAQAESVAASLGGTAVLAVGVSLLETPCTAGLPLLWTDLLAARDVAVGQAVALFVLYLAVFLLDELVMFGAAVVFLRAAKLQEQHGRALQLASGTLMVTLALTMLVRPALLDSVSGTLLVFAGAAAVAGAALLIDRFAHSDSERIRNVSNG